MPAQLGEIVSRPTSGDRLGLKFGTPQLETVLLQTGAAQAFAWAAGGGIWRMTYSVQRLDLIFDAMGFSDISAESTSVHSVCDRVSANLVALLPELTGLQRPVVRAAIVVTAQSSKNADGSLSVLRAIRSFLRDDVQDLGAPSEIDDVSVRLNRTTRWKLDETDWRVNRIEAASVDVAFQSNGDVERVFSRQLDANTSLAEGQLQLTRPMTPAALSTFLTSARDWLAERFETSEETNAHVR